jgi:hypothetical protein
VFAVRSVLRSQSMDDAMRHSLSGPWSKLSWKLFLPTVVLLLACAGGTLLAIERLSLSDLLQSSRFVVTNPDDELARSEAAEQSAQAGLDSLMAAEHALTDPGELAKLAEGLVQAHAKTSLAADLRRRRDGYYRRAEEREMELARAVTATDPLDFATRLRPYQQYLDHHPIGSFVPEARQAIETIAQEWDKYDFRRVRDHYVRAPGDVGELTSRCQAYQAKHPNGLYRSYAGDLLRWAERVSMPGEYRVTLQNGAIERRLARWFSRGPDVSVEIEVAGIRHGPSNIVVNSYAPEWDYQFPRRVRWQLGDPVRIRVTDHDYWDRVIIDIVSGDGDPLGMALLNGEITVGGSRLVFASDFTMPVLPTIE